MQLKVNNGIAKRIIQYEFLGFGVAMILLWLDEIFDLPHVCGGPPTPINWQECLLETLYVVALAIPVILATKRFLARIKYLEGFIRVCSFCKKVRVGNEWIPIERFLQNHYSETEFSHGLCAACMEKHYGISADD
ncbi:MAG: hypothetical protein AB1611_15085 [bacterium]